MCIFNQVQYRSGHRNHLHQNSLTPPPAVLRWHWSLSSRFLSRDHHRILQPIGLIVFGGVHAVEQERLARVTKKRLARQKTIPVITYVICTVHNIIVFTTSVCFGNIVLETSLWSWSSSVDISCKCAIRMFSTRFRQSIHVFSKICNSKNWRFIIIIHL